MRKAILLFVVIGILIPFLFVSCSATGTANTEVPRLVTRLSLENVSDNLIEASWEEPNDTSNIEGYIVRIVSSDGSVAERWVPVGTSSYSEPVEAGTYSIEVQTLMGTGEISEVVLPNDDGTLSIVTSAVSPDKPTNVLVSPRYNTDTVDLSLSWNQPGRSGADHLGANSDIESYVIFWAEGNSVSTASPNSMEVSTPATSAFLSGFTKDKKLSFIVVAKNMAGVISDPTPVVTIDLGISESVPPVSEVSTQLSDNLLSVSWIPPEDDSNIIGYVVTITLEGSTPPQKIVRTVYPPDTSYTEGLPAGSYTVSVQSKSSDGILSTAVAPDSGAVQVDTLATTSTTPEIGAYKVTENETDATLTLIWDEPTDGGTNHDGSAGDVAYYTIYWEEGNTVTSDSKNSMVVMAPLSMVDIEGLNKDSEYAFIITATNTAGIISSESDPLVIQSTETSVAQVGDITAEVVNNRISLEWTEPTDTMGIKSYSITLIPEAGGNPISYVVPVGTTSYDIADYVSYGNYMIEIRTKNVFGDLSVATRRSVSNTNGSVDPVGTLTSDVTNNVLSLTWDEPGDTMNVDSYAIRLIPDTGGDIIEYSVAKGETTFSETIPAGAYSVEVLTQSLDGSYSTPVTTNIVNDGGPVAEVSSVTTSVTDDTLTINWNEPADMENIATYIVEITPEGGGDPIIREVSVGTSTAQIVLPVGVYNVNVYSKSAGTSTSTASPAPGSVYVTTDPIAPDAPTLTSVISSSTMLSVTLSWEAPAFTGEDNLSHPAAISTYTVYWSAGTTVDTTGSSKVVNAALTSANIIESDGLVYDTEYAFMVIASNDEGLDSVASSIDTATTMSLASVPSAVSTITKQPGSTIDQLSLQWDSATDGTKGDGSAATTEYRVYYALADSANSVDDVIAANEATVSATELTAFTITGLVGASDYDIVIQSVNQAVPTLVSNSAKATLSSDGVGEPVILLDGSDVGATFDIPINLSNVTLNVNMLAIGVSSTVSWESSVESVATVDVSGTITLHSMGSTVITVSSVADPTKSDSVSMNVSDKTLSIYTVVYDTVLEAREGEIKTFAIQTNTIPADSLPVYSIVDSTTQTAVDGISIDSATGQITVDGNILAVGDYSMDITILPGSGEYVDSISITIPITVSLDLIAYKSLAPTAAQSYLTIGDIDNNYLYEVIGLSDISNVVAYAELTRVFDDTLVYSESPVPLFQENGKTYFGLTSMSSAAYTGISDGDNIQITVTITDDGILYNEEVLIVTKNKANIYTWWDLQGMQHNLAGDYVIQEDITFPTPGTKGFPSAGFTPVGRDTDYATNGFQGTSFTGSLDGNGKSISDLYINDTNMTFAGLFGQIQASGAATVAVQNIRFINPDITARAVIGVVAGAVDQGTITGVGVEGASASVNSLGNTNVYSGTGAYLGALAGSVNTNGRLSGYSSAPVTAKISAAGILESQNVGGLVGYSTGTVTGYATGSVTGDSGVGGLIGGSGLNSVTTGYATGNVESKMVSGGLVGSVSQGSVIGFATGDVIGDRPAGGLVGTSSGGGSVTGYSTGNIIENKSSSTNKVLVGILASITSEVNGYALGYILGDSSAQCTLGVISLYSTTVNGAWYGGRTAGEASTSDDHLSKCGTTSSVNFITESLSGSTGSRLSGSFTGFTFGTGVGEWRAADSTTSHSWPILNFPADFPGGAPVQNPTIGTPPEGY